MKRISEYNLLLFNYRALGIVCGFVDCYENARINIMLDLVVSRRALKQWFCTDVCRSALCHMVICLI